VLGEEEGGATGDRLWIIDPIDGTANYARGLPHYCVSIGYLEQGVPTLGAIYDPSHDWLYAAARGRNGLAGAAIPACWGCGDVGGISTVSLFNSLLFILILFLVWCLGLWFFWLLGVCWPT
jgi:hypothetical protein